MSNCPSFGAHTAQRVRTTTWREAKLRGAARVEHRSTTCQIYYLADDTGLTFLIDTQLLKVAGEERCERLLILFETRRVLRFVCRL
jgi:hypothetical protein